MTILVQKIDSMLFTTSKKLLSLHSGMFLVFQLMFVILSFRLIWMVTLKHPLIGTVCMLIYMGICYILSNAFRENPQYEWRNINLSKVRRNELKQTPILFLLFGVIQYFSVSACFVWMTAWFASYIMLLYIGSVKKNC